MLDDASPGFALLPKSNSLKQCMITTVLRKMTLTHNFGLEHFLG